MMPDLPMPVRMTRPLHCRRNWTAASKRASSRSTSARIAAASVCRTLRASDRSAMDGPGVLDDRIDCCQTAEKRLQRIEPQSVLRVAFRARGLFVHFEKDAVAARRQPGRPRRFDEL